MNSLYPSWGNSLKELHELEEPHGMLYITVGVDDTLGERNARTVKARNNCTTAVCEATKTRIPFDVFGQEGRPVNG